MDETRGNPAIISPNSVEREIANCGSPNCITENVTLGSIVASGKMLLTDRRQSLSEEQHDGPAKQELLETVRPRYLKVKKAEKQKILDEFSPARGYPRKHAIRALKNQVQAQNRLKGKPKTCRAGGCGFYSTPAVGLRKGEQPGYGAFSSQTAAILQDWLRFRESVDGAGNLFSNVGTGEALTGDGMNCIFKRPDTRLGFKIPAHDLRSSFATLVTIFGAPSRIGQETGRWSSIEQFEHYTGNLRFDVMRPYLPVANVSK